MQDEGKGRRRDSRIEKVEEERKRFFLKNLGLLLDFTSNFLYIYKYSGRVGSIWPLTCTTRLPGLTSFFFPIFQPNPTLTI